VRFHPTTRRVLALPAVIAGLGLLLTACGGSSGNKPGTGSSGSPASPAASSPASSPGGSPGADAATIKANWEAFFSSSTPTSRRVALLQNGSQFATLIADQSKSSLASAASAKVTGVSGITATQATVDYDIVVSGTPALSNKKGVAVKQAGTWKVGDQSFCGLLQLEKATGLVKITALPAACTSAG
jgi:hypothetical protein